MPNSPFCRFVIHLDRFANLAEDVTSTNASVQYFVRGLHLTQRSSFSASRMIMLNAAFASAGDICFRGDFDPWKSVRVRSHSVVVADLRRCQEDLLLRRKTSKNARE